MFLTSNANWYLNNSTVWMVPKFPIGINKTSETKETSKNIELNLMGYTNNKNFTNLQQ